MLTSGGTREPLISDPDFALYVGDALDVLRGFTDGGVHACVTSPPYLDARPEYPSPTLDEFEQIFVELRRVVVGPALFNVGRIWRGGLEVRWYEELIAAAERAGWAHLDTRIWIKPNANPIHGAVFADSHELVFVLGDPAVQLNVDALRTEYAEESLRRLGRRYTFHVGVKGGHANDAEAQHRSVGAHALGARPRSFHVAYVGGEKGNTFPAPMPADVAAWMVSLASFPGQIVLDPFAGSCTTAAVARRLGRCCIAIEQDEQYAADGARRLQQLIPLRRGRGVTAPHCRIWLCEWVASANGKVGAAELAEHERKEHPTAVAAREGLARWARIIEREDSTPATAVERRGGEPSATLAALPESSLRVHGASSPGRVSAQSGSPPRRKCVYCARPARPFARTCASHADIEIIEDDLA